MSRTPHLFAATFVALSIMQAACAQSQSEMPGKDEESGPDPADYDPVVLSSQYYSVLLEDENVRVLDWNLPGGESDSLHYHPDYGLYFITGAFLRVLPLERFSGDFEIPEGGSIIHKEWFLRNKNLGTEDLHAVIVELKEGARESAGVIPDGLSADTVAPDVYSHIREDYHIRMLDMKLPAGETDGDHAHPVHVVYVLEGGSLRVHDANGQTTDLTLDAGSVLSLPASRHRIENVGETDFHAVIFEVKEPVPGE